MMIRKDSETIDSVFVIGAGSAGVRAARLAAKYANNVYLAEDSKLGGTCVNRGCIPKKLFAHASAFANQFSYAKDFGWQIETKQINHNWSLLVENVQNEITRLNEVYLKLLNNANVKIIKGTAKLNSKTEVEVGGQTYSVDRIILAPGCKVFSPKIEGIDKTINSDLFFNLTKMPKSAVVMGGGYIALELAAILANLGAKVTVINRSDRYLRSVDQYATKKLISILANSGIEFLSGHSVLSISDSLKGEKIIVTDKNTELKAEQVILALGRVAKTDNLGLTQAGIKTSKDGSIIVDNKFRTSNNKVYALGDAVSGSTKAKQLTPIAIKQAKILIENWFDNPKLDNQFNFDLVSSAVFTTPPLAYVGLSYEDACLKFGDDNIDVYQAEFNSLTKSLIKSKTTSKNYKSLIRMIVEKKSDKILGLVLIYDEAPEVIQTFSILIKNGITKKEFDDQAGIHPSISEELFSLVKM